VYAEETLPMGPAWADVQPLITGMGTHRPEDACGRAIVMLLAIYALRASEVRKLRLEDLDWDHELRYSARAKGRKAQAHPLPPSVGNAIIRYLQEVRRPSAHRELFLGPLSPIVRCPEARFIAS
jgi:integrase